MAARIKVHAIADGTPFPDDVPKDLWIMSYDADSAAKIPNRVGLVVAVDHKAGVVSTVNSDGTVTIHGVFGGTIKLTPLPEAALKFPSNAEAFKAWNTVSLRRPRRPDGKPNKPLTALTVELEPCE